MTKDTRIFFGSKIGAILAAAGSSVGLGNIWRFPTETGANGGAAFILIYVLFMFILGIPVMISEFAVGRYGQCAVGNAFEKMSGGKKWWRLMGLVPVVSGFLVLSYYAVVSGWTLEYAFVAGANGFAGKTAAEYTADFQSFSSDPVKPCIWLFILLALNCAIVAMGIQKGIERGAKIMMPILFVSILVLAVYSMTLPGAGKGLEFLFKPDFSKVTSSVVLSAMGQAFFSLSVGLCCLCTYASYFRKDVNLVKNAVSVASIDTLVAIMAGLIIFPAVYSVDGLSPNEGPSLVFITLPNVFQQVFGGAPVLAYLFSLMFYFLLVMAAITSSISMLEMPVSYFIDTFGTSRTTASVIVTVVCFVLGIACALSFGIWSDVKIYGMGFFDLFDFLVAKFIMPIGALILSIFTGWIVNERLLKAELTNNGTLKQPMYGIFRLCVRYVAPACIILIFLNELGLLM